MLREPEPITTSELDAFNGMSTERNYLETSVQGSDANGKGVPAIDTHAEADNDKAALEPVIDPAVNPSDPAVNPSDLTVNPSTDESVHTDESAPTDELSASLSDQSSLSALNGLSALELPTSPEIPEPEDDGPEGLWPVFRNRNFLALWSGQVFSQIADKVYLVLMIAIISTTFKSPDQTISGWVSAIMIAFTIPAVLFGSLAGVYVDRWRKKPVLVLTNWLRGLLVALLPPLLWLTKGWDIASLPVGFYCLLAVTFLVSTLTQFFSPAEQAIIPLIVKKQNLLPANSLYTTTMMASVIVGFAVGEPLLGLADTLLAPIDNGSGLGKSVLVGVSYAIAGTLLLLMRTPESKIDLGHNPPHPWEDIKDGFTYVRQQVQVRSALIQLIVLFSIFAALAVLAVRLAEVIPAIRSSQFGFLLAAGGVGLALGAVLIGQFGQRFARSQLALVGALGMAAMLSALSLAPAQLVPSLGLLAGLGLFGAMVGIPMQTTIQEKTPEDMRGKVFGLQNNVVNIALSLPLALAGIAETFLGLRIVFALLAAMVAISGFFTWSLVKNAQLEEAEAAVASAVETRVEADPSA
jgi:MFS family permease